ncbi:MAG: alpha/beta hydrolase [Legionellaceae bacterium]|nr:alpha/beta hydrolase [Legionellaceae bacterium]
MNLEEKLVSFSKNEDQKDAELFVKYSKSNLKNIFILPGGPGLPHDCYRNYDVLSDAGNLIYFDPIGCGRSTNTNDFYNATEDYIDGVEAIRKSLGLEKIIIVGKSCGAVNAIGYALKYPDHIEKIVLAAGACSYQFIDEAWQNLQRIGDEKQRKLFLKLCSGSIKTRAEMISYFKALHPLYSRKTLFDANKFDSVNLNAKACSYAFSNYLKQFDYTERLNKITNSTLILVGRHDWITDVNQSIVIHNNIKNSKIHILEESSHAMEADEPELFFSLIRDFIREG